MADQTSVKELAESYADAFGLMGPPPEKDGLVKVMDELVELLSNAEGLDIETIDTVWKASRKLQNCIENDDLKPAVLADVYLILTGEDDGSSKSKPIPPPVLLTTAVDEEEFEEYVIPEDDLPLIEDFISESCEHLEAAEAGMLNLEDNPESADTLNLIFRSFHTIKGMSGFMNLNQIALLTHNAENLLDLARKGELPLVDQNADAIFKSIDMLKKMVDNLRDAISDNGVVPCQEGLQELADILKHCASGALPEPAPADSAQTQPSQQNEGTPEKEVSNKPEPAAVPAPQPATAVPAPQPATTAPTPQTASAKKTTTKLDEKIKVSTDRLDNLVNMVGELVIAQLMVSESLRGKENSDHELMRNTVHQGKIIRELQELAMSMRMVPIQGVFQKMARMTRDLSRRQSEKEVDLVMEGEQTELDRTIVDKLSDPLVHMIRNSVDHGIEPIEERKASGKPPQGTILLRAYHSAGCIVIEIKDDGRGLNREKLLEKAIERGIIFPDQIPSNDQEIFGVIFQPGFSTAAQVTSISGRGVGMDVVRRNIEELRGKIDIASTPGVGTTFTVTLPLTLAVIDGQMVRVGEDKYIIPINNIRRSFRPTEDQISTVHGQREMVLVRDELLPLVRLHELFEVEPDSTNPCEGLVVIVEEDTEACCMLVDDLLDQQQVVIKGLGPLLNQTEGVSGGAIMGDGMVRLILDIPGVIKLYRK
ncbi:MAG: chemotaxis protein CheA [Pontiellaceae bacterium]|nr:chemotaxis protein CheA [Pontiellaceae bacterium]